MATIGTLTVYYRTHGKWTSRFWRLAARLPGIGPYRRLGFISNSIAAVRLEQRIGIRGPWKAAPPVVEVPRR